MNLFDVLNLSSAAPLSPGQCKIHLATSDRKQNPLDVYWEGNFDEWQAWQTKKNFERPYIISLISLPAKNKWLFVGVYKTDGVELKEDVPPGPYRYNTFLVDDYSDLIARAIISFERPSRASYLNAETWWERLVVSELREKKMTIQDFPGFNRTRIIKSTLDVIMREEIESWKSALSNVAGIYLITDVQTGKLYVGSAFGLDGIWGRWQVYSKTGHGNNKELRRLLNEKGGDYSKHFQFSILEIADTHASEQDVLDRENYWKSVLLSREFGYNEN
jgi:hypothetical protein